MVQRYWLCTCQLEKTEKKKSANRLWNTHQKKKKARKSIRESSGLVFLFGDFYEQRHICA